MTSRLLAPLFILAATPAFAQDLSNSPLSLGYTYQPGTDIDGGGEVSLESYYVRAALPFIREEGHLVAMTARYQHTGFDFDGSLPGSFGALDPWDETHSFKLSLPVFWELNQSWDFFSVAALRLDFEDGADVGDSISGSLLTGAAYQWSDRLSIGPGFGVSTQIEDNVSIFPLVYVNWQVTDTLSLTTRPAGGAVAGPGLTANWQIAENWTGSFGVNYEKLRFRLEDKNAVAPEGVGETSGVPIYASLGYQVDQLRISVFGGVRVANELRIEDSSGHVITKQDADPAPFFGVNLSLHF